MDSYYVTVQVTVEVKGCVSPQAAADYVSGALYKAAKKIGQDAPTVEVRTVETEAGAVQSFD